MRISSMNIKYFAANYLYKMYFQIANVKLHKLVVVIFTLFLTILLLTHYYVSKVGIELDHEKSPGTDPQISPWITYHLTDIDKLQGIDLKHRIEELLRIKQSVSVELRELEGRKQKLQLDLTSLTRKLEDYKSEITHKRNELDRLQISLQQAKVAEKEAMERTTPKLGRPKPLNPLRYIPVQSEVSNLSYLHCNMDSCFDYSLCPISSQFSFYLYPLDVTLERHKSTVETLHRILSTNLYRTKDNNPLRSCIFLYLLEDCSLDGLKKLKSLSNWFGNGRNHIIWLNCKSTISDDENEIEEIFVNPESYKYFGRAMVVKQNVKNYTFRTDFDLVVSFWEKALTDGDIWNTVPKIVPAKRKYLATYLGRETESSIQSELLKIQQEDPASFVFQFSCTAGKDSRHFKPIDHEKENNLDDFKSLSDLCGNEQLRIKLLQDSTFSLIILPTEDMSLSSNMNLQRRLYESLKYGAIPVILGTRLKLPFDEVIDWSKIVFSFPTSRITEIHYLFKSITDADLLNMRKAGRLMYSTYMGTVENVAQTVVNVFRTRIGLPPIPHKEVNLKSVFGGNILPMKLESFTVDPEDEENLGPIEPPYPSQMFARNYSTTFMQKYDLWNTYFTPFRLFPFTPWDGNMPSEAKFEGSSIGFRPIGSGAGGSGKEFSESLGGNLPKEQFTVVMLTYERELVLMNSIQRLFALPYLNKVIVVWNSPQNPSPDLKWPDIGVPVLVMRAEKNSLNNRFLPFEEIETEAVLSIDDDAHLRHDEIVFGFRVWRENRDRIVGFPGRYHALDLNHGGWLYNSNYSCELSMVLTGAAFYHKIYSYLYTHEMPSAIRDKVDELMNCEDIAMNFLVSHVTQKPPVKVTSRWTFRCPGCPVTLSEDDSHFQERHLCINFFSKVYGYTPLLNTQFRADSVLFKTRIPHDKQKCFKYI